MRRKAKKILSFSLVFIGSLILLSAIVLFAYQKAYAGKIYNNIYFKNVNLSGLTTTQAEFLLKSKLKTQLNREINLIANDKSIAVKLVDAGLAFNYSEIANHSYQIGRDGSFPVRLKDSTSTLFRKISLSDDPDLDQAKYNDFVSQATTQLNASPQDATLSIKDGQVVLSESHDGQTVKTDTLAKSILSIAATQTSQITLTAVPAPAKIASISLEQANQQATNLLSKNYQFISENKKYQPTKSQVGDWIELAALNGQTVAQLNQAKIKSYLDTIAKDFVIASKDQKVNANTGEIIDPGREGVSLNKDKAAADVVSQVNNATISVTLATTTTPAKIVKIIPSEGLVLNRFDGKYIDVDLTTQRTCRIENQALLDCTTVSTGKASAPTPTGTFSISYKNPRAWSTASSLWMPWFQMFKAGGYGFHELPEWPNGTKEGANHLGIPVSHGCIRLGIGPAETLYNWTDIGTQVYIHK